MSWTITTDIFCDHCGDWMSGVGGVSSTRPERRACLKKAKANGWSVTLIGHCCPRCTEKQRKPYPTKLKMDHKR